MRMDAMRASIKQGLPELELVDLYGKEYLTTQHVLRAFIKTECREEALLVKDCMSAWVHATSKSVAGRPSPTQRVPQVADRGAALRYEG
jgi:hypothetical protein